MSSSEVLRVPLPVTLPEGILNDIVEPACPDDERLWVPVLEHIEFRPLFFDISAGTRMSVARVRTQGMIGRHHHPGYVHVYVIKGSFRYLEHPWTAKAGDYVFEPPGDIHTLTVPEDCEELIFIYLICGAVIAVDGDGRVTGFVDNWTMIDQCRAHFEAVGLGRDFVDRFIR